MMCTYVCYKKTRCSDVNDTYVLMRSIRVPTVTKSRCDKVVYYFPENYVDGFPEFPKFWKFPGKFSETFSENSGGVVS